MSWIDDIANEENFWLYKQLFPDGFRGEVIYDQPYIVKLYDFLRPDEVEFLIDMAKDKYSRSTILIDGKLTYNSRRTSQTAILTDNGCWEKVTHPEIEAIYRRVCILLSCSKRQLEGLMLVRYEEGEEFKEHYDYFEAGDEMALDNGGQRIATFFVWLNDLEEDAGGETEFTELGIKCIPDKGCALFWWNQFGDSLLLETAHRGCKVKKGVKYGLNIWVRYPGW